MPLKPKELTAARRGRPGSASHGSSAVATRNGLAARSMRGFGAEKFRLGTMVRCRIISSTLTTPASPAAVRVWPMLVLIEPMRQKPRSAVKRRNAPVRASTSIGSPSGVPVPWLST